MDNDRCPQCDSRYCIAGCQQTATTRYFVGKGWYEPDDMPEPEPGYTWSERWDGSMTQIRERAQISMRFPRR